MVKLIIQNSFIYIDGLRLDVEQLVIKEFSYELKNAFFIKRTMAKRGVPNYQPIVRFYNPRDGKLPIGFLNRLKQLLNKEGVGYEVVDRRPFLTKHNIFPNKLLDRDLRDYQKKAVDFVMFNKITFLEIGTGAGKTTIAAEIIRQNKGVVLFVVDRNILLTQTANEFKTMLGVDVGIISEGVMDLKIVNVATIQTLNMLLKNKNQQLLIFLREVSCFMIDEGHVAASKSYINLSKHLINADIRLGLSANYKREDGDEMAIEACVGCPEFKINATELIEQGYIMKPTIYFIKYVTELDNLQSKKYETYHEAYDDIIMNNKNRNNKILKLVNKFKGYNTLIIISKVEHGKILNELISDNVYIHGDVTQFQREIWLYEMKNTRGKVIIGTSSIIGKGLDIKNLDVMINATGNLSAITTIQSLGRVLRKADNKNRAYYIDFIDEGIYFKKHTKHRLDILIKQGHTMRVI